MERSKHLLKSGAGVEGLKVVRKEATQKLEPASKGFQAASPSLNYYLHIICICQQQKLKLAARNLAAETKVMQKSSRLREWVK